MYNKLFTKILDSSIWLETTPTRIVWITLLAAMDFDGFATFATVENVANRALVPLAEAEKAIACLEAPDRRSPGQDDDGRRIERVPGVGWIILNSKKYRDIVRAESARIHTRARVAKHREAKRNGAVTVRNGAVTDVTTTDAVTEALPDPEILKPSGGSAPAKVKSAISEACDDWNDRYGGIAPGGQIGKFFKPLVGKYGWPEVRPAWKRYLRQHEAQYASPARFSATFGEWSGKMKSRGAAYDIEATSRRLAEQEKYRKQVEAERKAKA